MMMAIVMFVTEMLVAALIMVSPCFVDSEVITQSRTETLALTRKYS